MSDSITPSFHSQRGMIPRGRPVPPGATGANEPVVAGLDPAALFRDPRAATFPAASSMLASTSVTPTTATPADLGPSVCSRLLPTGEMEFTISHDGQGRRRRQFPDRRIEV